VLWRIDADCNHDLIEEICKWRPARVGEAAKS
jgi:hypothetical protein